MEIGEFNRRCETCPGRIVLDCSLYSLEEIESEAREIGALVTEGVVSCPKGPRERFFREGETCRIKSKPPQISNQELRSGLTREWPFDRRSDRKTSENFPKIVNRRA